MGPTWKTNEDVLLPDGVSRIEEYNCWSSDKAWLIRRCHEQLAFDKSFKINVHSCVCIHISHTHHTHMPLKHSANAKNKKADLSTACCPFYWSWEHLKIVQIWVVQISTWGDQVSMQSLKPFYCCPGKQAPNQAVHMRGPDTSKNETLNTVQMTRVSYTHLLAKKKQSLLPVCDS